MFYSHSEIAMMSKSRINDIQESCSKNYYNNKISKFKNNKKLLYVFLVSKILAVKI